MSFISGIIPNVEDFQSRSTKRLCGSRFFRGPATATGEATWAKSGGTVEFGSWTHCGGRYMMYTWNLFVLYFGIWTLQKKAFSNQNRGHLGSRYIYIYTYICMCPQCPCGAPTIQQMNSNFSFCQVGIHAHVELHVQQRLDATACVQIAHDEQCCGDCAWCGCTRSANVSESGQMEPFVRMHMQVPIHNHKSLSSQRKASLCARNIFKKLMQSRHGSIYLNIYTRINVPESIWILINGVW